MKAKFQLGFMHGFINVPSVQIGDRHIIAVSTPLKVFMHRGVEYSEDPPDVWQIVFECMGFDNDKCAMFKVVKLQ